MVIAENKDILENIDLEEQIFYSSRFNIYKYN